MLPITQHASNYSYIKEKLFIEKFKIVEFENQNLQNTAKAVRKKEEI